MSRILVSLLLLGCASLVHAAGPLNTTSWTLAPGVNVPRDAIWRACDDKGDAWIAYTIPGPLIVFPPGGGTASNRIPNVFTGQMTDLYVSAQESAVYVRVTVTGTCTIVFWNSALGSFRYVWANGNNRTDNYRGPSPVVQPPQPELFVALNDGRACVIGERAVLPGAVALTRVVCFDVVCSGCVRVYNVSNVALCLGQTVPSGWPVSQFAQVTAARASGVICGPYTTDINNTASFVPTNQGMYAVQGDSVTLYRNGQRAGLSMADWIMDPFYGQSVYFRPWVPLDRSSALFLASSPTAGWQLVKYRFSPTERTGNVVSVGPGQPIPVMEMIPVLARANYTGGYIPWAVSRDRLMMYAGDLSGTSTRVLAVDWTSVVQAVPGESVCYANLLTDNTHCGNCDTACGAQQQCSGGFCRDVVGSSTGGLSSGTSLLSSSQSIYTAGMLVLLGMFM
jgi:hypothetical protein